MTPESRLRLVKLLALADRGIGGEATNARRILESALGRHGLTIDDLGRAERSDCSWGYKGAHEKKLLGQIIATVMGSDVTIHKYIRGSRLGACCTAEERVRIEILWTAHRRQLRKEMELMLVAYIHAQGLFPKDASTRCDDDLTEEEARRLERMVKMMKGIERVHVHMQLACGKSA
jgi:hypothetical protein